MSKFSLSPVTGMARVISFHQFSVGVEYFSTQLHWTLRDAILLLSSCAVRHWVLSITFPQDTNRHVWMITRLAVGLVLSDRAHIQKDFGGLGILYDQPCTLLARIQTQNRQPGSGAVRTMWCPYIVHLLQYWPEARPVFFCVALLYSYTRWGNQLTVCECLGNRKTGVYWLRQMSSSIGFC